ncbi:MAG: cupin domain-containing protein [Oscillospiraceae bacterium]|nr:cupin domain-containing protein [Oscillospiraceae bacterium]
MLRFLKDTTSWEVKNLKDGPGSVIMQGFLTAEDTNGKLTFANIVTIEPGCGIGDHPHTTNAEIYWIVEGELVFTEDGQEYILHPGDITYTADGHVHSIENRSTTTARMAAIVIN